MTELRSGTQYFLHVRDDKSETCFASSPPNLPCTLVQVVAVSGDCAIEEVRTRNIEIRDWIAPGQFVDHFEAIRPRGKGWQVKKQTFGATLWRRKRRIEPERESDCSGTATVF